MPVYCMMCQCFIEAWRSLVCLYGIINRQSYRYSTIHKLVTLPMLYLLFRRRNRYKVEKRVQVSEIAFPGGWISFVQRFNYMKKPLLEDCKIFSGFANKMCFSSCRHFYNQDNTDLTCCAFHKQTKILIAGFSSGIFALHELPEFNLIHTLR